MELSFSAEMQAFRHEVRDFIRANLPDDIRQKVAEERMDIPMEDQRRWHRILRDQGWAVPSWPREFGGPGWNDQQHYLFEREIALADAPRPMIYGVQMLGPTIIEFGTDAQKEQFLPGIVDADVAWCQGYSEPNAGSDLAALKCRAGRVGDEYVINGTKIWTSDAHHSDWLFGVFRTDTGGKKQHGITFLMLDLQSPGITITPIITYDGTHEVNQVFFEDVRVPATQRLGAEHQGWTVAKYLLGLERFGTAEVSRTLSSFDRLKTLLASVRDGDKAIGDDPQIGRRLTQIGIELRALELTEQRFLFGEGGADAMGAEASMLKVRGTEVQQMVLELTMDALGAYAQLDVGDLDAEQNSAVGPEAARYAARMFFNYRKTSIYSGSNEIQANIIAKHVLGLT